MDYTSSFACTSGSNSEDGLKSGPMMREASTARWLQKGSPSAEHVKQLRVTADERQACTCSAMLYSCEAHIKCECECEAATSHRTSHQGLTRL
jgi:hypothetical protein